MLRQLEQSKRYLKIRYGMHCETLSSCETQCISFALSIKKFENLHLDHDRNHTEIFHQCALFLSTIEAIANLVSDVSKDQDEKDELMYDVNMAKSNIFEWIAVLSEVCNRKRQKYMPCSYYQLQHDFG